MERGPGHGYGYGYVGIEYGNREGCSSRVASWFILFL